MEKFCDENLYELPKHRPPSSTIFSPNICHLRGITLSPLNPGNIANLHKKTRDIMPEWIEGLNFRCALNLDVHKTVCMDWLMGNSTPGGFRFGGMYCRKDNDSITKTPIIVGDTNPSTLATNFHVLFHPLPQIKLETKIQTGRFPNNLDLDDTIGTAEFLSKSSTISLALYNPKRETGRMTIGFLHNFNKNFCAGAELLFEWMKNKPQYNLAIAARYSEKRNSIAATISNSALDISIWHQSNDLLQFGASLIMDKRTSRTLGSLCYQYEMKDTVIKGLIDSDWTVGCTYTRQLKNLASAIGFSILFCIPTNKFHCGLKFELNSNLK
ncbi:mitochondrial import receptor subunit TOM40 homolog [Chironomus tepperi]|uniref:mitochondrial import receptor subunit TOM40 homolog n=1 Tax=Chironomus tepperi TaxID=113505 RepID=UPI00391F5276